MINKICGLLAMIVLSLFLGGLAYSIWENTESIAFPIIVAIVLIMAYVSFLDEVTSRRIGAMIVLIMAYVRPSGEAKPRR